MGIFDKLDSSEIDNTSSPKARNKSFQENENFENDTFYKTKFGNFEKTKSDFNKSHYDKSTNHQTFEKEREINEIKEEDPSKVFMNIIKYLGKEEEITERVENYKNQLKQDLFDKKLKMSMEEKELEKKINEEEDTIKYQDLKEHLEDLQANNYKKYKILEG